MSRSQIGRSFLALLLASLLPAASHAGPAANMFMSEQAFQSATESFYGGPFWFRQALASPRSLGRTQTLTARSLEENVYVGTLANPHFSADNFVSVSPFARHGSRLEPGAIDLFVPSQSGTWSSVSGGVWSDSLRWLGGIIANGPLATANFTLGNPQDITVTIDGAVASRTLGTLNLGDGSPLPSPHGYTIASSGGGTLTFDNMFVPAVINQFGVASNVISAPVLLANALNILNGSSGHLTISGSISSTSGSRTLQTLSGAVTISGAIGDGNGSVAVFQSGTGNLRLTNAANTYSGGTTVNAGTLTLDADSEPGIGNLNLAGGTLNISESRAASEVISNNIFITTDTSITTTSAASTVDVNFGGTLNATAGILKINNVGGDAATDVFAVRFSGGTFTMARPIELTGVTGTSSLNDFNTTGTTHTYNGIIFGTGSYSRDAAAAGTGGTTIFTGNNYYSGATTVNDGTLNILNGGGAASGRISGTSGVTVNSGGTLILSGSNTYADRINDAATMTLDGGTFNTGGLSEHGANVNDPGIGALTLTATSVIDMGSASSIIAFADSSGEAWTSGMILNIFNYTGTPYGGNGTDQLYFGSGNTGLSASQLLQINFYSGADANSTFLGFGGWGTDLDGEVVPVPEPGTWIGAGLALGAIAFTQRRRLRGLVATRA